MSGDSLDSVKKALFLWLDSKKINEYDNKYFSFLLKANERLLQSYLLKSKQLTWQYFLQERVMNFGFNFLPKILAKIYFNLFFGNNDAYCHVYKKFTDIDKYINEQKVKHIIFINPGLDFSPELLVLNHYNLKAIVLETNNDFLDIKREKYRGILDIGLKDHLKYYTGAFTEQFIKQSLLKQQIEITLNNFHNIASQTREFDIDIYKVKIKVHAGPRKLIVSCKVFCDQKCIHDNIQYFETKSNLKIDIMIIAGKVEFQMVAKKSDYTSVIIALQVFYQSQTLVVGNEANYELVREFLPSDTIFYNNSITKITSSPFEKACQFFSSFTNHLFSKQTTSKPIKQHWEELKIQRAQEANKNFMKYSDIKPKNDDLLKLNSTQIINQVCLEKPDKSIHKLHANFRRRSFSTSHLSELRNSNKKQNNPDDIFRKADDTSPFR